jgi:endoglucanase
MGLIEELCNAYGPAGREHGVRKLIQRELKEYCPKMRTDRLGNLIARRPAQNAKTGEKIMLCAHMDEIGLIITYIDKKGFLRFTNVGGIFPGRILHERVVFENGTFGVIGFDRDEGSLKTPEKPKLDKMYIDVGARNRKEAQQMVQIGDIASFYQQAMHISDTRISSKALDDRIGCYCLIEAAKKVKNNRHDLYFVFSVQEEVGLRGARTGAFGIAPEYALAVDVTDTGDTPEAHKMEVALGKGTAIKVKDSWFIANPMINDKLVKYAKARKIPYQMEVLEMGTTDAAIIQLVREGVMSGVLSIPTRYIHSTNEVCDMKDVKSTIELLTYVCEKGLS